MTEKIILGIGAVLIGASIWVAFNAQGKWNECRNKGGHVVELTTGWVCAKLEVIK